MPNMRCPSGSS